MIASGIASPASISSGICFGRQRVSSNFGFSAALTLPYKNDFPLISTLYPVEKDAVPSFRASGHILCRVSASAVATKVESDSKIDAWTQNLMNTDALTSTFEDVVILEPKASSVARTSKKERNPKRLSSSAAESNKPQHLSVIRYPLGTESAIKAMLECNTLVFVVDKHADKSNIKDTVKMMFKIRAKKVNTSIMPDGTKKAYVTLAPEFKASDVAKKLKIL